jgi:hypothetical protein
MEIAGRYEKYSIIMRCCSKGKWYITTPSRGSGCSSCNHLDENGKGGHTTYYDYLEIDKLKYVTDENIIKEALEPETKPLIILIPKNE